MKHERESAAALFSDISVKRAAVSAAIGFLVILISALALAALISADKIGASYSTLCALSSVFVGGFAASFLAGGRRKIFFSALITAVIMAAALALLGAVALSGSFSAKMFVYVLIILLFSCILGSMIASFIK